MVLFGHVELADSCIMIDVDVSLGLVVGNCWTVIRHGFIGRVGIWCAAEASNDFPYIWVVQLLALASLIANFCFLTSIHPFLPDLMYSMTETVAMADLCWDVWIDSRLRFLTPFGSADMK